MNPPHYSDEDISNDFVVEDELRLCLEDEERMLLEQGKNIIEEQRFRVEEAKRMRLEEDKLTLTCGSIIYGMEDLIMLTGPWSAVTLFKYFCKTTRLCFMPTVIRSGICRYDVSKALDTAYQGLDTAYQGFLGVGTMFDIFQNILFPYSLNMAYYLLLDTAYWILFPSWSLVSAGTDMSYLP
ncbi:hypothetical protein Tco_0568312 [Tanacetum coccineum]